MYLDEWMDRKNMGAAELGDITGVSEVMARRWRYRQCTPRLKFALIIEDVSKGLVKRKDLLTVDDAKYYTKRIKNVRSKN